MEKSKSSTITTKATPPRSRAASSKSPSAKATGTSKNESKTTAGPVAEKPRKTSLVPKTSHPRTKKLDSTSMVSPEERERMICDSAYFRAEKRGFTDGDPFLDWIEAEAEIDALLAKGK